jgi:hypothetical protein
MLKESYMSWSWEFVTYSPYCFENIAGKNNLGDIDVDGRIILK